MGIPGKRECGLKRLGESADKPGMVWVLMLVGIIGVWALLTVLGGEREQRVQELTAKILEAKRNSNAKR